MKHIMFPTAADADAFLADVQQKGATLGSATYTRRTTTTDGTVADAEAGAEDAGAGAVKGTGVGAVVGAAAGLLATAGAVATGGLAIPVILGFAALGSGVGAAVGATGGAMGIDENADGRTADAGNTAYAANDDYYDRMDSTVNSGGRVIAVQDPVPADVMAAATQHGGEIVDAADSVTPMNPVV
ncbi:hypothetical protein E7T09_10475 [Deinococcus sp. KSM4-11]|uniref:hypothetical protein n=1 Tax=Deinococcus sp. KSM4-11 TaxID=2568654 RepID=UPI0010A370CE|nr:hypothetical protein [Deinococcus sp. KSM4-11]THF86525.1 hypothetical protein E7T09_10475 [Deinococcus sp. KSM4-11]